MKQLVVRLTFIGGMGFLLTACGSPKAEYDKIIQGMHFIPFDMPMESTRVGTVLRGNNNEMYLAATPEKCFPDLPANREALRWLQATDLPSQATNLNFGFDVELNPILGAGSPLLDFKVAAGYAKSVSVKFQGASVEFLNESAFGDYYKSGMSAECKKLLADNPFIGQSLRVDGMSFEFKDSKGVAINLTIGLGAVVNVTPGVDFHIDQDYTLVITTPKYIGYRMAKYTDATSQLLYAATTDSNGEWLFKDVSPVIQPPQTQGFTTQSVHLAEPLQLR